MTLAPEDRVRRRRVRAAAATVILVAWAGALAGLVARDVVRTPRERLAELALRVNPGNVFYAVERNGEHVGWASSTIDTIADTLSIRDELMADLPVAGTLQRTDMRTQVTLSRTFALRAFVADLGTTGTTGGTTRIVGRTDGDSGIAYVIETNGVPGDTQRVRVPGPVLLPTLLPLAAILRGTPKVGRRVTYHTFDPSAMASRDVTLEILAESLFVVDDSASMSGATGRWVTALRDTVRAWRIGATGGPEFGGWVDLQGRWVETTQLDGLRLRRMAYELAFENWRLASRLAARTAIAENDIVTSTAIGAGTALPTRRLHSLTARLIAPSLRGFDLNGGRQQLRSNVLTITRERTDEMQAAYKWPVDAAFRREYAAELAAGPFIETRGPAVLRQAIAIVGHERDPRAMAQLLTQWLADSITKVPALAMPDAVQVLVSRRGDSNEHTQLFTALARSLDIPTRIALGLAYINGTFYYHAWPEVYLGTWVAVDPTFGQFPADAAHIRLIVGGLERQPELLRLVATLHIEVLEVR